MRKIGIFIIIACIFVPFLSFLGCTPLFTEKAICKIGKTSYSSLAEAIEKANEGDTIDIYNDVVEDINSETFSNFGLTYAKTNGNNYVEYYIDKAITLKGITQNRKQPKVYGNIVTRLSKYLQKGKTITIQNLEIINDYISLTDDSLNVSFVNAITVIDGNIDVESCTIHPYKSIDNDIIEENNLTCLNGISVYRYDQNISQSGGVTLEYRFNNNQISGYTYYNERSYSSAISLISNSGQYKQLEPFKLNGYEDTLSTILLYSNTINESNNVSFQVFDMSSGIYNYLATINSSLLNENNFEKDSIIDFIGSDFGFDELTEYNVYGQMSFKNVYNVSFIMKTTTSKVVISGNKQNVTTTPYLQLP